MKPKKKLMKMGVAKAIWSGRGQSSQTGGYSLVYYFCFGRDFAL